MTTASSSGPKAKHPARSFALCVGLIAISLAVCVGSEKTQLDLIGFGTLLVCSIWGIAIGLDAGGPWRVMAVISMVLVFPLLFVAGCCACVGVNIRF